MALDLDSLAEQMAEDMLFDAPENLDSDTEQLIRNAARRNAITIYNFVKSGEVTVTHRDELGNDFSETANIR